MKALDFRLAAVALAFVALLATAGGTLAATLTMSGDIGSDFVGQPGVIIRDGTSLIPPYGNGQAPLSQTRPDGTNLIQQPNAQIPSGFHISRVAVYYDCKSDTMYIGLDVSNPTVGVGGTSTNYVSRAWDADGDGNPCAITNDQLVTLDLDPNLTGNGNDDVPLSDFAPLGEEYDIFLGFGGLNITLRAYDDGSSIADDPVTPNILHKHFGNPCPTNPTVHATLSASSGGTITVPGSGVDFEVIYANAASPNYSTARDIEFVITGLKKIVPTGVNLQSLCNLTLRTFTDSDYDASNEASLNWGAFEFVTAAAPKVQCQKLVSTPSVCSLPATVTYTLQAMNTSEDGTTENITIIDPELGGPWTFENVAPGQVVTVLPAPTKTFGAEFCGSSTYVNTMYVSAASADCCATGDATASCQSTVSLPPPADVQVSCTKVADKTKLCTLPDIVTYTITVTNTSTTPTSTTIRVLDALLGIDQTFTGVKPGESKIITAQKTFGADFCGSEPFVNTATVSAVAEGCWCGNTTATSSCTTTVNPPDLARVKVSCTKTVDKVKLCTLPDSVIYTITAKNESETNTPVTMRIVDAKLGVDQSFPGVAQGATVSLQVQKTFGPEFCGSEPFVNTVTVSGTAEGCVCGTTFATSTCSASVAPPDPANIQVTCTKTVDKPTLCTLPDTVTYTLTATNTSITDTPVTLQIVDPSLGVNQTFPGVARGQSITIAVPHTFGLDFCGSSPAVNTMAVSAVAEGCVCGTVTATSTCSASVTPPPPADVRVSCSKTVDKPKLCTLPDTVTFTLAATNTSTTNTPVTLQIIDAALGVNQTFPGVIPGATVSLQVQKNFDVDFCGSAPYVNTMAVSAVAEGCWCGNLTATSTCSASVAPPDPAKAAVTCAKTVDKPRLCTLPDTVTFTLQARNESQTNHKLTIRIYDPKLGVDQTFTGVAVGEVKTVTVQKVFGADFCGSEPYTNTMSVTGTVEGCACGTLTATSSCSASVAPPELVRVKVSCAKVVDTPQICSLPATVNYQLSARNDSETNTPVTLRIYDAALGVDQTFTGVLPGEIKTVNVQKTFGAEFCGSDPLVNVMQVSAKAEGGCVCGTTTNTSSCTATVTFPKASILTCESLINGESELNLLKSDLPTTLHYQFKLCNSGQATLDCTLELPLLPGGITFDTPAGPDGKWIYTLGAGECFTLNGEVFVSPEAVPCPGQLEWHTPMVITATPSPGQCACPVVLPTPCDPVVTIRCPGLSQVYPATSFGQDASFAGYKGRGEDVINTIGGVFNFVPGEKWRNFVKAARDGWAGGYTLKNVVLKKETPEFIQCSEVFKPRTIIQQGSANIRTWWPLMYEAPGTKWTLTVLYGTGQIRIGPGPNDVANYDYDGDGPLPPAPVHTDIWEWKVDADLSTLTSLLDLFHELPFGMDEVPLISDEALYPALKAKLAEVEALVMAQDFAGAGALLGEFELEVEDSCISASPILPYPRNNGTGIAQTNENPACCKLLIDVEYIAKKLGLWATNK